MGRQGATNPEPAKGTARPELRGPGAEVLRLIGYPVVRQVLAGAAMEPASRVSCTSAPKFPNRRTSARIADRGRPPHRYETPASRHLCRWPVSKMGLIAMQKVEGSNPFSRFSRIPCMWAGWVRRGSPKPKSSHPAYHLRFGH